MKNEIRYKTNKLLRLALEYSTKVLDETLIQAIDRTEMFYDELVKIHKHGEILNMNVNGKPASGKSTIGMAIAKRIYPLYYRGKRFGVENISRDQQEFSIKLRDKNYGKVIEVIDEWNELEEGGENVTVETQLLNTMSDVQGQRDINKISCSPKESPDKNADILIEVIQPDKKNKRTHCFLYYKLLKGGIEQPILLGNVNIDVSDVIHEAWYKEYRRRKFEKMDLILQEGIFRPRLMEYAPIILQVTS